MLKKLYIYSSSDGLFNAMIYVWNTIISKIYRKSNTLFFKWSDEQLKEENFPFPFSVRQIPFDEIGKLKFQRLLLTPWKEWISNDSKLFVVFDRDVPIAYTWTHYGKYQIHGLGTFNLAQNECWIGPTFVKKNYRGKGINKRQIIHQININRSSSFYTSVNEENIPSCKSFERLGFIRIGQVSKECLFGTLKLKISGLQNFKSKFIIK